MAFETDNEKNQVVLGGTISDDSPRLVEIDQYTRALISIGYAHHEIHAGSHFMYTDSVQA